MFFTNAELELLHTLIEGACEVARDDKRKDDEDFFRSMFNETLTDAPQFSADQLQWLREELSDLISDDDDAPDADSAFNKLNQLDRY